MKKFFSGILTGLKWGVGILFLLLVVAYLAGVFEEKIEPGDAVPINSHQRENLLDARRALRQGDRLSALAAMEGLLRDASEPRC